jgi:hypothetical protein
MGRAERAGCGGVALGKPPEDVSTGAPGQGQDRPVAKADKGGEGAKMTVRQRLVQQS